MKSDTHAFFRASARVDGSNARTTSQAWLFERLPVFHSSWPGFLSGFLPTPQKGESAKACCLQARSVQAHAWVYVNQHSPPKSTTSYDHPDVVWSVRGTQWALKSGLRTPPRPWHSRFQ